MSEFIDKEPAKASPASSAASASSASRSAAPVITGGGGLVQYASSAPDPQSSTLLKSQLHFATTRDAGTFQHQRRTVAAGNSLLSSSNVELSCGGRAGGVGGGGAMQPPTAAMPGGRGQDNAGVDRSPVHCSAPSVAGGSVVVSGPGVENDVREIRRMLKAYIGRLENKDVAAKTTKEWRIVARVLDRLFFFCYIGTILVSLFTVFPHETDEIYSESIYTANEPLTTEYPDYSGI
jgi:hypothetical protein